MIWSSNTFNTDNRINVAVSTTFFFSLLHANHGVNQPNQFISTFLINLYQISVTVKWSCAWKTSADRKKTFRDSRHYRRFFRDQRVYGVLQTLSLRSTWYQSYSETRDTLHVGKRYIHTSLSDRRLILVWTNRVNVIAERAIKTWQTLLLSNLRWFSGCVIVYING